MYSKKELQNCKLCELFKTRLNALAGEGNKDAAIMPIAQAPGGLEDKENKMFDFDFFILNYDKEK